VTRKSSFARYRDRNRRCRRRPD